MSTLEVRVKYGESELEEYLKMLRWTEQWQKEMVAEQVASGHPTEDYDRSTNMPLSPFS